MKAAHVTDFTKLELASTYVGNIDVKCRQMCDYRNVCIHAYLHQTCSRWSDGRGDGILPQHVAISQPAYPAVFCAKAQRHPAIAI